VKLEYRRGLVRVVGTDITWRPAEFVSLLMGLRLDRDYLGAFLAYPFAATAKDVSSFDEAVVAIGKILQWIGLTPAATDDLIDFVATGEQPSTARRLRLAFQLAELQELFIEGAKAAATEGRLTGPLALELGHVRRKGPTPTTALYVIEADDAKAFGAWCLNRLLGGRRVLAVRQCSICGEPWLPDRRDARAFCSRPAPGKRQTCAEVAAQQNYSRQHGEYARERRRLGQQVRRGALARDSYEAWKADNQPGSEGRDWQPYDEWFNRKSTPKGDRDAR
jgi:hypothetical protein